MSVLHGCDPFPNLWHRRTKVLLPGVGPIAVLSLPDLVQAKKTQRDKDWPMVRRLIEADYHRRGRRPPRSQIEFWLARPLVRMAYTAERALAATIPEQGPWPYAAPSDYSDMKEQMLTQDASGYSTTSRYPTPGSVSSNRGRAGSASIL